jgi:pyridoxine 5-phosphate synthase
MAATEEMSAIAARIHPDQVTLVPERPQELTTQGGLDVVAHADMIRTRVAELKAAGIKVSIFIDADSRQVRASREVGACAVEINTGGYADPSADARDLHFQRIADTARSAADQGLEVLAGHGLDYMNVRPIAAIPQIVELNIGHSIIARSVLVGLDRAVRDMIALLK